MTQKAKKIFMVVVMSLTLLAPVVNSQAAGLNVCGDPVAEQQAVEKLYNLRRDQFPAGAQGDAQYNAKLQAALAEFESKSCKLSDIFGQIAKITNFLIAAIGIFVVFMLVNAGFTLATNFGNEEKIKGAKKSITNAILGLILVLVAFAVVNTLFQMFQVKVGGSGNVSFPFNPFD